MKTYVAAALCGVLAAGAAHATDVITGQLNMGNVLKQYEVTVVNSNNKAVDNDLSTGVALDFAKGLFGADFGVSGEDGSLDKINVLGIGNVGYLKSPLKFKPFASPITDFFTSTNPFDGTTISFDLDSLTINAQTKDTLSLVGYGTLYETHYSPTPAEWLFSTQAGGKAKYALSWSGDAFPTPAPEPASIALFGIGVLGLGLSLKRRRLGYTA